MEAFYFACLFLSLATGEIFGYEVQPVDAVLFLDGAPTYMRMTNSTSLENVYACILENSRNVDSVVMATQMRGLLLDVGQVEENVNESIRRLPGKPGQSVWKPEEDAKMLKARLAKFLTIDYHDSRIDPGAYLGTKFQRSTGWSNGGGQPRTYSGWRESSLPEQARGSLVFPASHSSLVTPAETNQTSSVTWTSISPTEGTTTKTSSVVTKHYPSPATASTFEHIPARPSEPFSSNKYVKTGQANAWNGSDIASDITKKPENVSHTFDNTLDREKHSSARKTISGNPAPSPELKDLVRDANAGHAFSRILTEEAGVSDWSSTTSSDTGDGKATMASAERERRAKERDPQKKSAGETKKTSGEE